jgi:uncharacterized protein (TIGR02217 family)
MAFHEVRFPANLSFGSVGGPERRTEVVALTNGFEERNTPWAEARRRYDAGVGLRSLDDIADLIAFFEARQGQLHGFRWKDWADCKSSRPSAPVAFDDQVIGVGDGVMAGYQLLKTYASGAASTVRIGLQGDELQEGVHYTVDTVTGLVSFASPPAVGERVTAGFEFDVPVRFDTDRIEVSVASFQAGDVPQVPVVEVRL